jgi:hypothetical protein
MSSFAVPEEDGLGLCAAVVQPCRVVCDGASPATGEKGRGVVFATVELGGGIRHVFYCMDNIFYTIPQKKTTRNNIIYKNK